MEKDGAFFYEPVLENHKYNLRGNCGMGEGVKNLVFPRKFYFLIETLEVWKRKSLRNSLFATVVTAFLLFNMCNTNVQLVQAGPTHYEQFTTDGRQIDLYTQDWRYPGYHTDIIGLAPAQSGSQVDTYSPQDLVCLCAKLTYNGEPICCKEVAFEVHGPANPYTNITLWRQTFTNGSGIAEICFRIPWADIPEHAENITFGTWWAVAKASVSNEEIGDSHWWLVRWIIDIESETVSPNSVYELGTVTVSVTVKNWALTPRNFTHTATLYDELGVPVGASYMDIQNAPPNLSVTCIVQIFVPEWAYVGIGHVYKNIFTKLPWLCGVCWCPEYSEIVVIKATDPHIP